MDTHQHLTIQECRRRAEEDVSRERQRIRRGLQSEIMGIFEELVVIAAPGQLHGIEAAVLDAIARVIPEE